MQVGFYFIMTKKIHVSFALEYFFCQQVKTKQGNKA